MMTTTKTTLPPTLKATMMLAATMPLSLVGLISAIVDNSAIWAAALSPLCVLGVAATAVLIDFALDILRRVEGRRARNRLAARVGKSVDRDTRFVVLVREEIADAIR